MSTWSVAEGRLINCNIFLLDGREFAACHFPVMPNKSRGVATFSFLFLVYGNQFLFTKSKKRDLSLLMFRQEKLNLKAAHSHMVSCQPRAGGASVYLFIEDIRWDR